MRTILTAAAAFTCAALMTGQLSPGPHWAAVAADLHRAQPQARMSNAFHALVQERN
jgi:hypothetical protein